MKINASNYSILLLILALTCCELADLESPDAILPSTADQDPRLPQIKIKVQNQFRTIHLETFGNPINPPLFVLHGGPGADYKLLLRLKDLSDNYYVVMWDSRGAGLSERVPKDELLIESFNEELNQIKLEFAPDRTVILVGHSFGGNIMARYTAMYPELVENSF
jgi:proline iminopeptidase